MGLRHVVLNLLRAQGGSFKWLGSLSGGVGGRRPKNVPYCTNFTTPDETPCAWMNVSPE